VAGVDRHELHHETEWSLPVDFHSCRRVFATALAEAGVEPRMAMRALTSATSWTGTRPGASPMRQSPV
jgi:hypothetical protein